MSKFLVVQSYPHVHDERFITYATRISTVLVHFFRFRYVTLSQMTVLCFKSSIYARWLPFRAFTRLSYVVLHPFLPHNFYRIAISD